MAYQHVLYDVQDKILTITLNRPEKLNSFVPGMVEELIDCFDRADADDEVRAIIVTGAGRGFCAGADVTHGFDRAKSGRKVAPLRANGEVEWSDDAVRDGGGKLTLRIYQCLKPVIAAINGPAVGVGVTMTLPMDIRIAADTARFGLVFARRGIVPEACSSWFLPRVVGISQALEWCYSGRVFPAQEALDGRLIKQIVKPEELLPTARAIAREIIDNTAPVSIALTRQMLWRMLGADHPMEGHKLDSRGVYSRSLTSDPREGSQSFLEKRPAKFENVVSKNMPAYFPWWEEPTYK
jgi:enoyl-CoA hydratase/carnithine racemase